eukprot:4685991-Amphidinium_carterae.1
MTITPTSRSSFFARQAYFRSEWSATWLRELFLYVIEDGANHAETVETMSQVVLLQLIEYLTDISADAKIGAEKTMRRTVCDQLKMMHNGNKGQRPFPTCGDGGMIDWALFALYTVVSQSNATCTVECKPLAVQHKVVPAAIEDNVGPFALRKNYSLYSAELTCAGGQAYLLKTWFPRLGRVLSQRLTLMAAESEKHASGSGSMQKKEGKLALPPGAEELAHAEAPEGEPLEEMKPVCWLLL